MDSYGFKRGRNKRLLHAGRARRGVRNDGYNAKQLSLRIERSNLSKE